MRTSPFSHPEESALFEAVMALPEKLRVTIHLHYYEGYSCDEIAQILHVSRRPCPCGSTEPETDCGTN